MATGGCLFGPPYGNNYNCVRKTIPQSYFYFIQAKYPLYKEMIYPNAYNYWAQNAKDIDITNILSIKERELKEEKDGNIR